MALSCSTRHAFLVAAHMALAAPAHMALAQATGTIRGTVTDSSSQRGVPSAQVEIVGTQRRTITNDAGVYTFRSVPAGSASVRVHRIGFEPGTRTVSVAANDEAVANFALRPAATMLTAVVSVGYGTANRQNVSSAIASVDSATFANVAVAGIDNALQGKIAGVQVMQNSGDPGSGVSIRVRGPASVNAGNQPLYVVDGVPIIQGSLGQITAYNGQDMTAITGLNPDEIATIDVLKDAAAAAIYGSRGSNGVILVTTKRGQTGRTRFSLSTYAGTQRVERTIGLLNATQYVDLMNESAKNDGYTVAQYDFKPGVDDAVSYDWQAAVFRPASVANANLSVSGGTERLRYYISAGDFNQRGIVIGSGYERQAGRLNLDLTASDKLFFSSSVGFTRENDDRIPGDLNLDGVVTNAIGMQPMRPILGGSFGFGGKPDGLNYSNPVAIATYDFNTFKTVRTLGNVEGKYLYSNRLWLTARLGMDNYGVDELTWASPKVDATYAATSNGVGRTAHSSNTKYVAETFLTVQPINTPASKLSLVAGTGMDYNHSDLNYIRGENFPTGFSTYVRNAAVVTTWDGSATDNNLVSYFTRADFSLHDRYLLSASVRTDGSSRFGKANKYGMFPAVSLGWIVTDESFAQGLTRFGTLKLRGSVGVTGNQGIGDFASLSLASGAPYSGAAGVALSQLGNPNLRWETTKETDLGADVALLDGRVDFIGDWFLRSTTDLLVQAPVPATSGFTSIWDNIGGVRNRGFDLGVHTINLRPAGRGFGWTTDLNVTWNHNEVTDLYQGQSATYNVSSRVTSIVAVGQPIGEFYLYKFLRVDPATGNAVFQKKDGSETGSPTSADLTYGGNPQPKYYGGLTNTFTLGRLDLRGFFQFSQGGQVLNMMRIFTDDGGYSYDNKTTHVLDRWQKPGDITNEPRMSYDGTSGARLMSTRMVEDGSFVRLGEVTLGYRLPDRISTMMRMESGKVFVTGRNLHTWTKYTGYNPDVNSRGVTSNVVTGVDYYAYPLARAITFGVTAGW